MKKKLEINEQLVKVKNLASMILEILLKMTINEAEKLQLKAKKINNMTTEQGTLELILKIRDLINMDKNILNREEILI